MNKYTKPEMKIAAFDVEDIISASNVSEGGNLDIGEGTIGRPSVTSLLTEEKE